MRWISTKPFSGAHFAVMPWDLVEPCVLAGSRPGDEVLVQSLTYVGTFQAISAAGATPVPCEVDVETCTLDPDDARQRLTERTAAVVPVHYAGCTGRFDEVRELACANGLRVIEDAAHAFGGSQGGKRIGSFGDVTCFSFDGIKNITSGEGGALVTDDAAVTEYAVDSRLLAVGRDTQQRFAGTRSWDFDVRHQGYRYHMSDVMAAIGRVQLARFERELKPRRQLLASRYAERLQYLKELRLLPLNCPNVVPHIYPVRVLDGRRDAVRQALARHGIETGIHYKPNHLLTYYRKEGFSLPVTEALYTELLTLPLHPSLTDSEQDEVIRVVETALQ